MNEQNHDITLIIKVDLGSDTSQNKLDMTTRELRSELKSHINAPIDFVEEILPFGARSSEAFTIGALALATVPSAVPMVLAFIHNWCLRAEKRTIEIEIQRSKNQKYTVKITGDISPGRLKELIDQFES